MVQTVSSLKTFVLAMLLFPECQRKAQAEIDRVIGTGRLPTFEDKDRLPYIDNLINEVMRWQPVTPLGNLAVPHACTQDDVYRNYRIPKGAIVKCLVSRISSSVISEMALILESRSMSRNEEVYKNSECFNPDRFIDPQVPKIPAFGFGRRLCPGIHYAGASIYITIVSILAAYNITKAKDENGEEITPSTEGVAESVVYSEGVNLCKAQAMHARARNPASCIIIIEYYQELLLLDVNDQLVMRSLVWIRCRLVEFMHYMQHIRWAEAEFTLST
ncbi:cytochrome P450 domain-containing protein [Rhizoctonia solani AG-1 IA]|uniref:Cytochrome P450 domain-containing protein n=1 Tax=Thanatephorus cucumeris (strain AG1-IA) TaxID=983506 RepID=L8WMD2_THACA|nr:cytochrome P450 domain-containing protein [Rhizoctonia solani AG-1 IA]